MLWKLDMKADLKLAEMDPKLHPTEPNWAVLILKVVEHPIRNYDLPHQLETVNAVNAQVYVKLRVVPTLDS